VVSLQSKQKRNLRRKFSRKEMPSMQFVDQFVKRIRQTGSLLNKAIRSHACPVRSTENIAAVAQSVLDNHQHQLASFSKLEHFMHFFEKNFE